MKLRIIIVAVALVATCGCIAANPMATERDAVEEDIKIGIAADSPQGWRGFDNDLSSYARDCAESNQYSTDIKPVYESPLTTPYQLVRMAIQSDTYAQRRFELITDVGYTAGVGVVDLGNGTYRVCIVTDSPPGYPIPVLSGACA